MKGFTLIEVLIVLAVLSALLAAGSFIDLNNFKGELLNSENTTLISLFQKARNQAMNNINHAEHGIHLENDKYILFEGPNYLPGENTNREIPKNASIMINTVPEGINDIVFSRFSGDSNVLGEIILNDGLRVKTIKIKEFGLIDW